MSVSRNLDPEQAFNFLSNVSLTASWPEGWAGWKCAATGRTINPQIVFDNEDQVVPDFVSGPMRWKFTGSEWERIDDDGPR